MHRHLSGGTCLGGRRTGRVVSVNLGWPELVIVLVIVLLVFGGAKLPKLARSLGEAKREFETSTTEGADAKAKAKDTPADPSDRT